ncbi:MAG: type II secretion system protein N [Gammaproteobacteria bacterium]|nr:MAG: type II secretion system protein N [Gammaproteobacteria bacterium]
MKFFPRLSFTRSSAAGKKSWRYIAFGLLAYIVFLLATLPASWLAWGLHRFGPHNISLTQPLGSVWRGQAILIAKQGSQLNRLGLIEWDLHPLWLFTGKLGANLRLKDDDTQASTDIKLGYKSITASRLAATLPANALGRFYAPVSLAAPEGTINIKGEELVLDQQGLHGQAIVQWRNAGSQLSPVKPLGDYRLTINGKGKSATFKLNTNKGALQLSGNGNWDIYGSGQLNFNGTATPRQRNSELESLLSLLGKDLGGGRRLLRLNTRTKPLKFP